jgi:hypothetical protein
MQFCSKKCAIKILIKIRGVILVTLRYPNRRKKKENWSILNLRHSQYIRIQKILKAVIVLNKELKRNLNNMMNSWEKLRRLNDQPSMDKWRLVRKQWLSGMHKYFQIYNYSSELKARMSIYNLTEKQDIWWEGIKRVKSIKERNIT